MKPKHILFVISKSTGYFALKSFVELNQSNNVTVLVLDDREDNRTFFDEILQLTQKFQIETVIARKKECLDDIVTKIKPELVFVCGWYWIISDLTLNKVKLGFLGIHNSLLPKYRGHAPLVWSMINGDKEVGSSLFKIVKGMDEGNVFHQWKVQPEGLYLTDVLSQLDIKIYSDFGSIILDVLENNRVGVAQIAKDATYSAKRREADGVIDWTQTARDIVLKIKALSEPYPNAFMFINNKKIKLKKAEEFEYPTCGESGQVALVTENYAVICCGLRQAVKITEASNDEGETSILKIFSRISSPLKFFE